jgi:RNA polymerase sigma-70 factor (ECF subfamily)
MSGDDADDLVQETLLKVWARVAMAHQGHCDEAPIADLRAFAFDVMRDCASSRPPSHGHTHLREPRYATGDPLPTHLVRVGVLRALRSLPPDQAQMLRLRAVDGLSYAAISARTGVPLGTVTSRLSRGRAALRRAMGLPPGAPVSDLFRAD